MAEEQEFDNALERELASKQRKHPRRGYDGTNTLTAEEERASLQKNSDAKRYDGRKYKNSQLASLPRVKEALENFYDEIKLPELKKALEVSDDPRFMMLLGALGNPRFAGTSFSKICQKCRLSMHDVVDVWRNYINTQVMVRTMTHMPEMIESAAIDGTSRDVICPECQGVGKLRDQEINKKKNPVCGVCHGDGKIRVIGDKDRANLAAEVVGLRKAGGISQTTNINLGKGLSTMEDEIAKMEKAIIDIDFEEVPDDIQEGGSKAIEAGGEAAPGPDWAESGTEENKL